MEYAKHRIEGACLEASRFAQNGAEEIHLMVKPATGGSFSQQVQHIIDAQNAFLDSEGIPREALVFCRFFVSDYANQYQALETIRELVRDSKNRFALSIIQQPPLSAHKVVAWSYIIHDGQHDQMPADILSDSDLIIRRGGYEHLWSTHRCSCNGVVDSAGQTNKILRDYNRLLESNGFSMKDDCIRTWFYVKDIDYHYQGVVEARKDMFTGLGMTPDTHYIASTGIEGRNACAKTNVLLDAYSVRGLSDGQIRFLTAPENLNPTHEYGVTFERGVSVDYGDRRHVLISGTASINNKGEILHVNDVASQTARAMVNIEALLADADFTMCDVAHLIVYLRDISDSGVVQEYLDEHYSEIPKVYVLAPVCRPGWLVEIECMGVKAVENETFAHF
ncbi:Rid family hydrolase [Cerasicoccus maritimus]|uniref:Rid family hydrolase n=1 Tax=Cerasicoccus maritimus TaxID=490089 RepID=UPI0028529B91|nr:Rid family hydrolase [Cerasicoccus maritimus]